MPPGLTTKRVTFPFSFITSTSKCTQQLRNASILSSLSDNKGAYNKAIRRGRGPSSGKGKTSGRGHKGQKQHGKVPAGFQGGQTPIEVVHGKRGFENQFSLDMTKVNLDRIQSWIDQGRLDTKKPITIREMHRSRLTHGIKDGVKLLARNANDLKTPIHITVSRASAAAIAAVEAVGGSVQTRYYTSASIKRILQGKTHPTLSLLSQAPHLPSSSTTTSSPSSTTSDPSAPAPTSTTSLQNPHDTAVANKVESLPQTSTTHDSPAAAAQEALLTAVRSYRYRLPDPASRKDLEYYRDPAHRGYLAYQLREGQGPSLFFKSPTEVAQGGIAGGKRKVKGASAKGRSENRVW